MEQWQRRWIREGQQLYVQEHKRLCRQDFLIRMGVAVLFAVIASTSVLMWCWTAF
jgi:hypothetical protein